MDSGILPDKVVIGPYTYRVEEISASRGLLNIWRPAMTFARAVISAGQKPASTDFQLLSVVSFSPALIGAAAILCSMTGTLMSYRRFCSEDSEAVIGSGSSGAVTGDPVADGSPPLPDLCLINLKMCLPIVIVSPSCRI